MTQAAAASPSPLARIAETCGAFMPAFLGLAATRVWLQVNHFASYSSSDDGMLTVVCQLFYGLMMIAGGLAALRRPSAKRERQTVAWLGFGIMTFSTVLIMTGKEAGSPDVLLVAGVLAGVGGALGGGMWTMAYVRLGMHQAVLYGFLSLALGSAGGLAVSFLPDALGYTVSMFMPAIALLCYQRALKADVGRHPRARARVRPRAALHHAAHLRRAGGVRPGPWRVEGLSRRRARAHGRDAAHRAPDGRGGHQPVRHLVGHREAQAAELLVSVAHRDHAGGGGHARAIGVPGPSHGAGRGRGQHRRHAHAGRAVGDAAGRRASHHRERVRRVRLRMGRARAGARCGARAHHGAGSCGPDVVRGGRGGGHRGVRAGHKHGDPALGRHPAHPAAVRRGRAARFAPAPSASGGPIPKRPQTRSGAPPLRIRRLAIGCAKRSTCPSARRRWRCSLRRAAAKPTSPSSSTSPRTPCAPTPRTPTPKWASTPSKRSSIWSATRRGASSIPPSRLRTG